MPYIMNFSNGNGAVTVQPAPVAVPSRPLPGARPTRDSHNQQSLGVLLNSKVKQARVLMVGAGGIGCELLKNLVLSGFGSIDIVDLDTIDLSNLNRQFLFRHEHIKKPKALIAKAAAQKFNPKVEIRAHHANIKDAQFSVSWFAQFAVIFNALDNLDARRHVNRMCLAADVPLVESGTTGFNGQVQVIKKGVTACYDCSPKPVVKSYPVCTIRSTPSQPVHCIEWGKSYLLSEIFGAAEGGPEVDAAAEDEDATEIEELKKEAEALRKIRESVGSPDFARLLFDKVFNTDMERLRSVEDMWKTRRPPEPLQFDTIMAQAAHLVPEKSRIIRTGQEVWSLEENFIVLLDSLERLSTRMLDLRAKHAAGGPEAMIAFDKDDEDTLDFVAASANIRSTLFVIDRKSRFDIKQMAGNIIPAIATTNAIVAGLCVLEAFKVLREDYMATKEIFLTPHAKSNRFLGSSKPMRPNPKCPVCSSYPTAIAVDLSRATLSDLVEDVLRTELGYGDKDFVVNKGDNLLYDVDETENLSKRLADLGITAGSILTIIDEDDDDPCVNVDINIEDWTADEHAGSKPIKFIGQPHPDVPRRPKAAQEQAKEMPKLNGGAVVAVAVPVAVPEPSRKRARADEDVEVHEVKRAKTETDRKKKGGSDDEPVVVGDDSGGAIVILDD